MATDEKIHIVEEGETLESISMRYYGRADLWERLQKANLLIKPSVYAGRRLRIPSLDPELLSSPEPLPPAKPPVVILSSGQTFTIEKVTLYEEEQVREIAVLRAKAMKNLGGFSSGIGFLGSPEWALGGAAALGLFESLISGSMKNQAIEILRDVQQKSEKLTRSGRLFDADKIENFEAPDPHAWSGTVREWGMKRFVHSGSDFVSIVTAETGFVQIRWSSVAAYSPPQLGSK